MEAAAARRAAAVGSQASDFLTNVMVFHIYEDEDLSVDSLVDDIVRNRGDRANCLNLGWSGPIICEEPDYFSVFTKLFWSNFASYRLILPPWVAVMILCVIWILITEIWLPPPSDALRQNLLGLEVLITSLGGAIAFLLAFRLARTSVRFYDARCKYCQVDCMSTSRS